MKYRDWLVRARQELQSNNSVDRHEAHLRARLLLDFATRQTHAHLLNPDEELPPAQLETLRAALQDALRGRPLPYILGTQHFFGREFLCREGVLIPRPETELLVETALSRLADIQEPRVADMGTGTGCIAITVALERPDALVTASELSPEALPLAIENARRLGAAINFVPGLPEDWGAPLKPLGPFHALLSNPPYIAAAEIEGLQPEVSRYEPRLALEGGTDGLDAYRALAMSTKKCLVPGGFLAMELGAGQNEAVTAFFASQGWQVEAPIADFAGHARVLIAKI